MHLPPSNSPAADFGLRLRAWRDGNQFDLDAASRLLGVSDNFLYMIERGKLPPSPALAAKFEEIVRGLSIFHAPEIARRIPVVSWVQAGRATDHEQMPDGYMDFVDCLCPDPKAFAVRLRGESMLPKYPPGNLAVCMPSFPPKTNHLVVAKLQDESTTFKTVTFRGQQPKNFRLVPLNPEFSPVTVLRANLLWLYPVHCVLAQCN